MSHMTWLIHFRGWLLERNIIIKATKEYKDDKYRNFDLKVRRWSDRSPTEITCLKLRHLSDPRMQLVSRQNYFHYKRFNSFLSETSIYYVMVTYVLITYFWFLDCCLGFVRLLHADALPECANIPCGQPPVTTAAHSAVI